MSNGRIRHAKTLSLMTDPGTHDELAALQRQLEKYQKYHHQHPELYDGIKLDVVISPALLRTHNLYFYFLPFHLSFDISVMINAKSVYCQQSLRNIRSLTENNIAVCTQICD